MVIPQHRWLSEKSLLAFPVFIPFSGLFQLLGPGGLSQISVQTPILFFKNS